MVGILALFPVASSSGRESSEETQAAILAQTIADELIDSASQRGMANGYIVAGPNTIQTASWRPVNLRNPGTYYVAYDLAVRTGDPLQGVGMQGNPIAIKSTNWVPQASHFISGAGVPANVLYLARVDVQPLTAPPGVSQVSVTVETPATQASTNRRSFRFATLVQGP